MLGTRLANGLSNKLIKGVVGSFGLRLGYTGLTFLVGILFARVLGTAGFGTYTYAVVWAYLLSVPATLGLDNYLVREIAIYPTQAAWPAMRGLLLWADRVVLTVAVSLVLAAILVAWWLDGGSNSETFAGFCLAVALMPALSLRNIRRGAMRGLHHITQGLVPELLIDPLILIGLTGIAYLVWPQNLSALWAIAFYGTGTVVTLLVVNRFLARALPAEVKTARPEFTGKLWLSGAIPFMLLESIPLVNSQMDVLMLGAFRGVDAVGLYVPVNRGAQLIGFILIAVGSTLSPTIASAYGNNRVLELQRTITKSVRLVTGVAFLFAIGLILCGTWYLSLFGPEFIQGQRALYILCVGIFTSTSTGFAYVILNMTGYERYTAKLGWITAALNVVLNAVLIPRWGVEGAALATSASLVAGSFMGLISVRKKLGIDATLIGLSARPPEGS